MKHKYALQNERNMTMLVKKEGVIHSPLSLFQ